MVTLTAGEALAELDGLSPDTGQGRKAKPRAYRAKNRTGPPDKYAGALQVQRAERFAVLLCDGNDLADAYDLAGFPPVAKGQTRRAAATLLASDRVKASIARILERRAREGGAVTLGEVTEMLRRVYYGSMKANQFGAAHNAAFSLGKLHGLVIDRAQVEIIRRPSRDPDAPVELDLKAWVEALPGPPVVDLDPGLDTPADTPAEGPDPMRAPPADGPTLPADRVPGLDAGPPDREARALDQTAPSATAIPGTAIVTDPGHITCNVNDYSDLADMAPRAPGPSDYSNGPSDYSNMGPAPVPGNGAPSRGVTGTPSTRAHSDVGGQAGMEAPLPPGSPETGPSNPAEGYQSPGEDLPDKDYPF